ncbi:MAG TPA: hypothetical protein VKE96_09990 [Vicinamibacterales bacterium]|nr:hypothetical protein [Vicinamibacterales bacterium]
MSSSRDARWNRRRFLRTAAAGAVGFWQSQQWSLGALDAASPQLLYNGIRLSSPWPPRYRSLSATPITPPYLIAPPAVIPIDVGRQLFVDDFLIEQTSLSRTFHRAEYYGGNPVLQPSTDWEKFDEYAVRTKSRPNPAAMPFSDGVFYDPRDRVFKMWYMGGYGQNTCYAVSHDGIAWDKPALDVVAGTNMVTHGVRDSSTVWLDLDESDRSRRYKMARWYDHYMELLSSSDGIHWREMGRTGLTGDRTTFFFNPFRRVWVYSLRGESLPNGIGRHRRYWETPDLFANVGWGPEEPPMWVGADGEDPRRADLDLPCELYNLDCVAYESLVLGLFTIFRGERNDREKPNDLCVGFSRDGFHWSRPDRRPFLTVSERVGAWNWANVQSAGGCCLVVGDELYFYVSGRRGLPGTNEPGVCSTGLAKLRRDGFVSMDAGGPAPAVERVSPAVAPGTLTTRPVRFDGRHLFANVDASAGELRVEMLDADARPIPGFTADACVAVRMNSTHAPVTWSGSADLARLSGETVRFRFHLTRGSLYAFWVSASTQGASDGYLGAGGPGYSGVRDRS